MGDNKFKKINDFINELVLLNKGEIKDIALDVDSLDDKKPILLVSYDTCIILPNAECNVEKVSILGRPNQILLYNGSQSLMKSINLEDLCNLIKMIKEKYPKVTDAILVRESLYSNGELADSDPVIDLISEEDYDFSAVEIISFCDVCPSVNVTSNSNAKGDSVWQW